MHAVPLTFFASAGQVALLPVQFSATSHSPAAARHRVLAGWKASAGHASLVPSQVSATSQTPAEGRQTVPAGSLALAGQVGLVPVQVSSTSHAPAAARHTVPAFPAGWVHVPLLHTSLVHGLVSSAQAVPSARWLARHVPAPSQLSGWSQSELLPLPQAVPAGWKPLSWQAPRPS